MVRIMSTTSHEYNHRHHYYHGAPDYVVMIKSLVSFNTKIRNSNRQKYRIVESLKCDNFTTHGKIRLIQIDF